MNSEGRAGLRDEWAPLLVVLIWGLNFPVMKAVLAVLDPHAMNVVRIAFSVVTLGALHLVELRRSGAGFWSALRIDTRRQVAVGLLSFFVYQVVFIIGLDYTTAGSGALLMASAPVWTAVIATLTRSENLKRIAVIGLAVSIAGTVMVVMTGRAEVKFGEEALLGNVLMLGAALCWGSVTALSRPLVVRIEPVSLTFFSALVSLPLLAIVGAPYLVATDWSRVGLMAWLAIAASGTLSTGLATWLWNRSVLSLGASHTAAFGNAVPIVAVAAGALFLSEPVVAGQVLGGTLIIGGLLLMRRARRLATR